MAKVIFKRKNTEEIKKLPVEDGSLIFNYETGETYMDYEEERINTGSGTVASDTYPIGAIAPYGGITAPTNWLICDGSAISRTLYADLFSVIGTSFGSGDGSTTFNLPDLRSKIPLGKDSRDTDFDTIGKTGGEKEHTLTVEEMPAHEHNAFKTGGDAWTFTTNWTQDGKGSWEKMAGNQMAQTGGSQPHNNMPPHIVCSYIIKAFQSVGTVGNVVNEKSESTKDTYSCDYLNTQLENLDNKETYSTEEQVIGKWIDGKTLYRKTLQIPSLKTPFYTGMDNIDILIFDLANSYLYWNEELLYSVDPAKFTYNRTQHTIYSRDSEITSGNWSAILTIKYTKTTE